MSQNDDNTGCLLRGVIISSAVIGGFLLLMEGAKSVGKAYRRDPGSVIWPVLIIGGIALFIYWARKVEK